MGAKAARLCVEEECLLRSAVKLQWMVSCAADERYSALHLVMHLAYADMTSSACGKGDNELVTLKDNAVSDGDSPMHKTRETPFSGTEWRE